MSIVSTDMVARTMECRCLEAETKFLCRLGYINSTTFIIKVISVSSSHISGRNFGVCLGNTFSRIHVILM